MESIKLYLREVEKTPLLTAEEEVKLARLVRKGNVKARLKMIQSNLRLVISIAKRYSYLGVPMMDLIEEGNMGLMRAVSKFKPSRGFRFSTYGAWWIKQYVARAIANQGKTVRVPVYMIEMLSKYKKVNEELSHRLKRKPRLSDIAKVMKLPIKKVKEISQMANTTYSLNMPVGETGTSDFMDLIEDERVAAPSDDVASFLRHERVTELLNEMRPRERKILILRYGLKDGVARTLGETAKHFGITRERVRQIEAVTLKKLKELIVKETQIFGKPI